MAPSLADLDIRAGGNQEEMSFVIGNTRGVGFNIEGRLAAARMAGTSISEIPHHPTIAATIIDGVPELMAIFSIDKEKFCLRALNNDWFYQD